MQLEDWLDDLCVRFIINLPPEELVSVERICFQVEEAQWFYEDFIRPLDPSLPSLTLRTFSLRIFQHCPLFSQWSTQHHTTAFAEFMAYKSRVPVRGAIMLNEAMDEVVLVKGWKKSANWSFPRGKINKDENDLDCAVREVYEETGFDIRAAGLVKDENEMKYIEVTMREQHMRLYVFRGVPKDTVFEPKTRKEISKIEWYKLTDLPTLKKNRPQEGSGTDQPALAANKFYMVAPFLNPLKKWITQQRKKENRYSSRLSAPPMVPEEAVFEDNHIEDDHLLQPTSNIPQPISDLPEVSASSNIDPSVHLKELLNIGYAAKSQPGVVPQPSHLKSVDTAKSTDLLALLRGGTIPQKSEVPQTPLDQMSIPLEVQQSPHVSHVRSDVLDHSKPPPHFQIPTPKDNNNSSYTAEPFANRQNIEGVQRSAPYQQTGDPQFARQGLAQSHFPAVPDASALPQLTNHTKALLDVFRGAHKPPPPPLPSTAQTLLSTFFGPSINAQNSISPQNKFSPNSQQDPRTFAASRPSSGEPSVSPSLTSTVQPPVAQRKDDRVNSSTIAKRPESSSKTTLLQLFQQPQGSPLGSNAATQRSEVPPAPAELAATNSLDGQRKPQSGKDDLLLALLKSRKSPGSLGKTPIERPSPREGETAATISGPLNQPEFESISRSAKHGGNELGRTPLASNRTLYDPSQPTPMKILTRADESRQPAPRSPRTPKALSKRSVKEKPIKEQSKPFQPQILRRPQTIEPTEIPLRSTVEEIASSGQISKATSTDSLAIGGKVSGTGDQKQTLLSLFGNATDDSSRATGQAQNQGIVSPLSVSQLMSPNAEISLSGIEPVSTRTSRVGSMASMASGPVGGRGPGEKRQTAAENKAFLLGYLGRIASQDS